MSYQLSFEQLIHYDYSKEGICLGVILELAEEKVYFEAKIDTAATYCIFERKYGEALGLDIESGVQIKIGTATGSFLAYGHYLRLSLLNEDFDTMVYFAAPEYFNKNVLGRRGWLDLVIIGIVDYEEKLYFSRYQ